MKCHQRLIRESSPPEPDEDIKRELAKDLTHASVREIDYATAKPVILKHESFKLWVLHAGSLVCILANT